MSGQPHAPVALPPGIEPLAHCIVGWVGPRASLNVMEKRKITCPYRKSNPGGPVRSLVAMPT
jgi:hypothetical protein